MKPENEIISASALAYFGAYKCLINKYMEDADFDNHHFSSFFIPAITNAAFSCELALKGMFRVNETPKGHDLFKLFMELDSEKQEEIIRCTTEAYNMKSEILKTGDRIESDQQFLDLLKGYKDTFVVWRYFYENDLNLDLDFIEALMFCLNDYSINIYRNHIIDQINKRDKRVNK
nr:hypothetical protein [Paenibacillus xylanexedens]